MFETTTQILFVAIKQIPRNKNFTSSLELMIVDTLGRGQTPGVARITIPLTEFESSNGERLNITSKLDIYDFIGRNKNDKTFQINSRFIRPC